MSRRLYDFKCSQEHITEGFVDYETTTISCSCGEESKRIISPVRISLDGTDPTYVSAYDKWAKRHEDKQKQEAKRNEA
jgi:hypothetical protein